MGHGVASAFPAQAPHPLALLISRLCFCGGVFFLRALPVFCKKSLLAEIALPTTVSVCICLCFAWEPLETCSPATFSCLGASPLADPDPCLHEGF